eukprot:scaffold31546_cov66-Phaeocystis_antarctica.AAC.10
MCMLYMCRSLTWSCRCSTKLASCVTPGSSLSVASSPGAEITSAPRIVSASHSSKKASASGVRRITSSPA